MEITSNYSNYAANYADTTKKSSSNAATEVKTTTSTNSKDKVQEYYEKLCKKFPEITFNKGGGTMSGNENKVVLNLSSKCLEKMANDPEFAKKVEFNLSGVVSGHNNMFAQAKADNAVIHGVTAVMDADGNVSVTCGGMTRTSGSKQNSTTLNTEKYVQTKTVRKKTEKKSAYGSSREYSEYLNNKYACLTPTKNSSVSINSSLLSKAATNSKTAEWLENTLSQMPDCINKICENSARNGAKLVSLEISIDSEDCITTKCVGLFESDPGTEESKKMLEEARARNKERKEEWEKLLEKNKEKKAEQEKQAEKKSEQESVENQKYDITVMGTEMEKVVDNLISKISMGSNAISTPPTVVGFDIKA